MKIDQAVKAVHKLQPRKDDIIVMKTELDDTTGICEIVSNLLDNKHLVVVLGKGQTLENIKNHEGRALYDRLKKLYDGRSDED